MQVVVDHIVYIIAPVNKDKVAYTFNAHKQIYRQREVRNLLYMCITTAYISHIRVWLIIMYN